MNIFTKIFIPIALGVCLLGFAGLGFSCDDINQTGSGTTVSQPIEETPATPIPTPAEEIDSDRDGLFDAEEAALGTNPNLADTDGDGYSDLQEVETGHDPLEK